MDPFCGTAPLCLGWIRQNVSAMYMNDRDGALVKLARARAQQYFVGCRETGVAFSDGNGSWVGFSPGRAELDHQGMYAL